MLHTLKLLLPALIPSWRFFDEIAPSPRIEFTLLANMHDSPEHWQEFRPRPARLSVGSMGRRLFYNADWNESLFLVSCAERLTANPTEHSQQEIYSRIKAGLGRGSAAAPFMQFRLAFLSRHGATVQKEITYISPLYPMDADA